MFHYFRPNTFWSWTGARSTCFYHGKGFRTLIAVRENYFPNEASGNYGAILRAKVPHAWLRPFFAFAPLALLRQLATLAPRFAVPDEPAEALAAPPA